MGRLTRPEKMSCNTGTLPSGNIVVPLHSETKVIFKLFRKLLRVTRTPLMSQIVFNILHTLILISHLGV